MGGRNSDYKTGKRPGRPARLSPVVVKALVDTIASGSYITTACKYVGISSSSYSLWRRRGEAEVERVKGLGEEAEIIIQEACTDDDGKGLRISDMLALKPPAPFRTEEWPYAVFLYQIEKAQAAAEIRNLTIIQRAAGDGETGSWQAAAWILERKFPDRFGRRERINLSGAEDGDPIKVEQSLSVENLEAAIERMRRENGDG